MKRLRLLCWVVGISALTLCGRQEMLAQEVTATVTGTVTDTSGAVVAGAVVTVKSVERGVVYTATTNDSGLYHISQLPVGNYEVRVEKPGFSSVEYPAFTLSLNQVAKIDVEMKVGQVSQTIEVSGAAPILKTESTQVDTVINMTTNDNLPLASRNYVQLTLLAPGSVSTDPSSFNNGNNTAGYGGRPLINGNREQANNFLLDGMDNNQVSDNLLGYTPAPDAIQEFNLITNNAPAEFGNFMGGIVNATIRSGTNSFHGDVWEFFRNDKLNANSWSNNFNTSGNGTVWDPLPKARLRWNMFGGTLGGPVLKNKLFFFVDYQGQRFDIPSSFSTNNVFTDAERTGDFSALCPAGFTSGVCSSTASGNEQLYNPCVSFTAPCTPSSPAATNRQPFPNNQIPLAMISPVAANLFASSLYPTAIGGPTQLKQNAVNSTASAFNVDQGDIKVDYKATDKDTISGRFTRAYQNNPSTNSQVLLSNGYGTTPIFNTVGDWTRVISTNLVNDARFGWSHVTLNSGNSWDPSVGQFGKTIGIGNGNPAGLDGLLAINLANTTVNNFGTGESTQSFDDHVWQAEDSVTWTRGRHTLKFGGQYFRQIIKTFYAGNNGELGYLHFDGRFSSNVIGSIGTGAGDGGADFFLGLPDSYGRGVSTGKTWEQSSNIFAFYGQDTWRVTERLTLNLGLRYEAHTPWVETNNQQANYNMATGNVDLANQNGASRGLYNGFYGGKDFQPRIGFAWTPAILGGHTVVRGAFTVSSYLEGTGTNLRLTLNAPFTPAEINTVYNGVALPATSLSDGIVGTATGASCAAPAYACYAGALLRIWDPHVQPAIDDQWHLSIQRQFWGDTTFQIGYLGQRAYHLMVPFDYAQRVLNSDGTTSPSPFFAKNLDLYNALGNGGPGARISGTQSNGTMMYNSLQAVLQKQMSHGLQYQVSYTYSKCMSDNSGYYGAWNNAISAYPYWQNVYDKKAEWAPCYYDATHILSAYAVYELPFGRGKALGSNVNKVVNGVIGGWGVSPIVSFRTGFPLAIAPGGVADTSGTFSRGERPDCNSIPTITGETPIATAGVGGYQWFTNNNNFSTPAAATFGSCPNQLGYLRTAHYTDVDLSLHKDVQFTERFKLQFRADFINAFNHVQLNAPYIWDLGSSLGQVTSAQPPRNIQLALKLYY
jgi:Carboxypeptidase regulatory-like domain